MESKNILNIEICVFNMYDFLKKCVELMNY